MARLSRDNVRSDILSRHPSRIVADHVLERIPYIFDGNGLQYSDWRHSLSRDLGVDPINVSIIGSACVGFSLTPGRGLPSFSKKSDVDVSVISPYHFDTGWRVLRSLKLGDTINSQERQALIDHKQKYIYYGCIAIDRVLRLMPFSSIWMAASARMAGIPPTEEREIKFRLYRDFESLRSYQENGIQKLRSSFSDGL